MPVIMACPRTGCNHPGPMGFTEPRLWGMHFYHQGCAGAWEYRGNWYDTEAEAWTAYKRNNPHLNKNWVKAFDARILKGSERLYKYWIKKWDKEQERFLQSQLRR